MRYLAPLLERSMVGWSDLIPARFLLPPSEVLKEDANSRVERFDLEDRKVVRKFYQNRRSRLWRTFSGDSKGGREFRNLLELERAGVPVVRPLSWRENRLLGCVKSSWLVTEWLEDAPNLKTVLAKGCDPATRRALARSYGELTARVHRAGFLSMTLSPRNVLVRGLAGNGDLYLCDQPSAIKFRRTVHGGRLAGIDLYTVAFSNNRCLEFSRLDRYRLVLAYAAGNRQTVRRIWARLHRRRRRIHRLLRVVVRLCYSYLPAPFLRSRASPPALLHASGQDSQLPLPGRRLGLQSRL